MKLIISTIVSAIVIFLLGWLGYGVILKNFYITMSQFMREPDNMRIWALIVGQLLQGLLLSYIYMKVYKGESPFGEGFKFGFSIGVLFGLPYVFILWATYKVRYIEAIVDGLLLGFIYLVAGIVIGLIFGKKNVEKTV